MPGAAGPIGHDINKELRSPSARFEARLQKRTSATALQARVMAQETSNLAEAFASVTAEGSIVRASSRVVAARRRFVIGSGKSFAYADLLASDLSEGLSNVQLIDDTVLRAVDVLADVRETDVLVAFSFRRYRTSTVKTATLFHRSGGTVVAITDDFAAPLTKIADESIVVLTDSASFADSPTAVCAVVHVLGTMTTASAKGARRRLRERDRASEELALYWSEPQEGAL